MERIESQKGLEHPSSVEVIHFFKDSKQIISDALEMSILPEFQKKKIVEVYNRFAENLENPECVEKTMVVFDSKGDIHRVRNEDDGSYNLEIAILVLFGADYLGSEMRSAFTDNRTEAFAIYTHMRDEFLKQLN